jgi:4-hydroxy-tetrahydrodipicolinate synthase
MAEKPNRKMKTMQKELKGTGVAIVTPFNKNGGIDFGALENLVEHIIVNKVDFVVGLGTTSEAATMTGDEKMKVMETVRKSADGRVPVVMGIGGNNTAQVVEEIGRTDFDGIAAILSVAPYYNRPNQRGIYAHFSEIARACPVHIILYNVPSRTSSNISAQTVLDLANEHWNVIAVKEASGDLDQISRIIRHKPDGFLVLSGDDALTFPMMALGADGVISVVANAFPAAFSGMVRLLEKGKYAEARKIHYSLLDIIDLLFADGNPAGVKAALNYLGVCKNHLRLPLVPVSDEINSKLKDHIRNYESPY